MQNTATYRLSPIQHGMLFHALERAGSGVDVEQIVGRLPAPVDPSAFVRAWEHVFAARDVLRTAFEWEGLETPVQVVHDGICLPVRCIDWRSLAGAERQSELDRLMREDRALGFDLSQPPLMRLALIDGGDEWLLLWTFHHVLLDGRSFPHVLEDVFTYYDALCAGAEVALKSRRPYTDYISWLGAQSFDRSENFWQTLLAGFSAPTVFPPASANARHPEWGAVERTLSPDETMVLAAVAKEQGVTMATLLHGAWALLLGRYTGQDDVVFGATRACRRSTIDGADEMLGLFINTLPIRTRVANDAPVAGWLQALRQQQIAVRDHEHAPLSTVQAWSEVPRGTPLFESLVVFENAPLDAMLKARGGAWADRHFSYRGQTNFPAALIAYGGETLLLRLEYDRHRIDDASANRALGHLTMALRGFAARRERLGEIGILTPEELVELIAPEEPARFTTFCLHQQFEAQAAGTPDAIALTSEHDVLSYAVLNRRANQLAHRLLANGVAPDTIVGLHVRPSADIVVGILGILKAGGAYVPLDPAYPADRLQFIVRDAHVRLVVAGADVDARRLGDDVTVVSFADLADEPDSNPSSPVAPDNLAYVIYTSGSTGQPKGALVTHANVSRLFEGTDRWFMFGADDVWTLFHSYAFDFSVWEIWGALLYGGRLVVVPYWVSRSPDAFLELLRRERVTVLNQTPSAFVQLVQADAAAPGGLDLRYVVLGGEALDVASLRPWFERRGDDSPRVINMYGITETTVHVTYRPITRADVEAGAGSVIGVPIPDLEVYVLDSARQLAPIGVAGEMYVGGAGVARGYLNRPELSEARFVPNPVRSGGARVYRTGDLARRLPNGDLEYRGRIDDQVKIRGFRIELGEIESVLAAAPGVQHAAVIADGPTESRRLVGYIVQAPDSDGLEPARAYLRAKLPEYMVPGVVIPIDAMPLTSNGKVDRRALPAADSARPASRAYVAPRTPVEQTLAGIWEWVLRRDQIGIDDNFFELGGDSILSIQLVARCRRAGLRLTTQDVFRHPTIAALATVAAPVAEPSGDQGTADEVPLTPVARWFFDLDLPDRRHWNQSYLLETPPGFDVSCLEEALDHVAAHHEALRLRCARTEGGWRPHAVPVHPKIAVRRVSLAGRSDAVARRTIRTVGAEIHASLDLSSGPLVAAAHLSQPDGPGRLLIAIHHLAVDAVSWRVLLDDVELAYHEIAAGRVPQLPAQPSSIASFVDRLTKWADGSARASLDAWLAQLGTSTARLPRDREAPPDANRESSARTTSVWLSREETAALLQQVPAAYRAHIDELLLASLAQTLAQWTGRAETVVDLESHGRHELFGGIDLSGTVGWFTAIYPVRLHAVGTAGPEATIRRIKETLRGIPDRGQSFGALRYLSSDSAVRDALASRPRPEVLFNYLGHLDHALTGSTLFGFAREDSGPSRAASGQRSHLLEVNALVVDGRLQIQWTFSDRVHDRATVRSLAERYAADLRAIVARHRAGAVQHTPIDFPLAQLTQGELDHVLAAAPAAVDIYPLSPIQHLFYSVSSMDGTSALQQWEFSLDGPLDVVRLKAAWDHVLARHAVLRTSFVKTAATEPLQVVNATAALPWHEEDWRGRSDAEIEASLAAFHAADRARPFELASAPLMRAALLKLGDERHRLIWTTHYLLIDGWSWPIIFRELAALYPDARARDVALPPSCGFRTYIEWLRQYDLEAGDRFWRLQLEGFAEPTALATRPPATGPEPGAPVEIVRRLSAETTRAVEAAARAAQVTPGAVIAAAWSLAIAHVSARADVVFGASFQGRPAVLPGMESMVGPCANDVPVRTAIDGDLPVGAWLRQMHERLHELSDYQHTPLTRIHAGTAVPASLRLFDSLLKVFYEHVEDSAVLRLGAARITPVRRPEATSYPLTVVVRFEGVAEIKLTTKPTASREVDAAAMLEVLVAALHALAFEQPETVGALAAALPAALRGRALERAGTTTRRRTPVVAPRTEMERTVAQVWQDLFGDETIGLDENWFDLGAHSLLLARAHEELRALIKPDLTIVELLQYPTVRTLAAYLSHSATRRHTDPAERAQQQRQAASRRRTFVRTS